MKIKQNGTAALSYPKARLGLTLKKDFKKYKLIYLLMSVGVLYYIIFMYFPMYGLIISFKDYSPALGIMDSPWVGLKHFKDFFQSIYSWRLIKNTLLLSIYSLIFGFPIPILFAIMLNEMSGTRYKRIIQSITYMPHFISIVVICGLIVSFTSTRGIFNYFITMFGGEAKNWLMEPSKFRMIYVLSGIWQTFGWDSIIYLSALTAIDPGLHEAATIDGAGRIKRIIHVTIPGIMPTIVVLLIMKFGSLMSVGYEKVLLLYTATTRDTADIISTFTYRTGIQDGQFSYASAIGMFNSVVNCILLFAVNKISKKIGDIGLF